MRKIYLLFIILIAYSCNTVEKNLSAQEIIDKTTVKAGVDKVVNSRISFDFRDKSYLSNRKNGIFSLERITKTGDSITKDVLSNNGFERYIDDKLVQVSDSMAIKYSESINSVHYFATLPYGLNDKAVKKKLLQEITIKEKTYYKIEISFEQEGGGVDYEDVFVYWIEKENFTIDYMAYKFHVNGGGVRFREVTKEVRNKGIRFVNYNNYKPRNETIDVSNLDIEFQNNNLVLLSEINLENIKVVF